MTNLNKESVGDSFDYYVSYVDAQGYLMITLEFFVKMKVTWSRMNSDLSNIKNLNIILPFERYVTVLSYYYSERKQKIVSWPRNLANCSMSKLHRSTGNWFFHFHFHLEKSSLPITLLALPHLISMMKSPSVVLYLKFPHNTMETWWPPWEWRHAFPSISSAGLHLRPATSTYMHSNELNACWDAQNEVTYRTELRKGLRKLTPQTLHCTLITFNCIPWLTFQLKILSCLWVKLFLILRACYGHPYSPNLACLNLEGPSPSLTKYDPIINSWATTHQVE